MLQTEEIGRQHFNAGRFREAHEAWELGFRSGVGARRAYFRALAQMGAAFVHAERGNFLGALRVLDRACQGFSRSDEDHCGDVLEQLMPVRVNWVRGEMGQVPQLVELAGPEMERADTSLHHTHPGACPYCGEPVAVEVSAVGDSREEFVEDCPVCCHPWTVRVRRDDRVTVVLQRQDG